MQFRWRSDSKSQGAASGACKRQRWDSRTGTCRFARLIPWKECGQQFHLCERSLHIIETSVQQEVFLLCDDSGVICRKPRLSVCWSTGSYFGGQTGWAKSMGHIDGLDRHESGGWVYSCWEDACWTASRSWAKRQIAQLHGTIQGHVYFGHPGSVHAGKFGFTEKALEPWSGRWIQGQNDMCRLTPNRHFQFKRCTIDATKNVELIFWDFWNIWAYMSPELRAPNFEITPMSSWRQSRSEFHEPKEWGLEFRTILRLISSSYQVKCQFKCQKANV